MDRLFPRLVKPEGTVHCPVPDLHEGDVVQLTPTTEVKLLSDPRLVSKTWLLVGAGCIYTAHEVSWNEHHTFHTLAG